ncbi:ABC-F family ATP-binding cassette domain-containing protein [Leucobacter ruminantium]|uniref:ABC-F family ATP-binding cassette domain-containing protein n=1 Tax=Leucobacter ruminantium TaxID=1289170 RepID=A0A939LX73_9MICO|nr:ATP-binding cassette domain-containing protein [Leucobacter ruminantium]MBO1804813.1 ABC-F family ATP-binding cassette domain-containing protein [Leucobacter ruminantium]
MTSSNPTTPNLRSAARAATRGAEPGASPSTHLAVDGVSHGFADRRVLSDISFTAAPGDRLGLIGENGTGKSTLLRIIAGEIEPSSGTVVLPGSVGLLAQELPYPDTTPLDRVLDDAQRDAVAALERIERLGERFAERPDDAGIAEAYAEALERAERCEAWSAEARRGETLTGLGLGGFAGSRPIGELSGGQRLRLALAAVLLRAPQTLLLDEPSNHLDDASAAYLERVLAGWPGIVIVASHDRALLDAVTTGILDLDALPVAARELADAEVALEPAVPGPTGLAGRAAQGLPVRASSEAGVPGAGGSLTTDDPGTGFGVRHWGVGYSAARAARRAEMARWRSRYEAESAERDALVHEIEVGSREVNRKHESKSESRITRKFYADKDARVTARRARNARVRLETLERERVRRPPEPLRFHGFGDPGEGSEADAFGEGSGEAPQGAAPHAEAVAHVLRAERVAVPGRLRETSLELEPRGRILLSGPNGAGKSTLLALLAGAESAPAGATGTVERAARVGYLPQEASFDRPERAAAAVYRDAVGAELAETIPLELTGLIAARDLGRPVAALSVGQRRRLALAALVADPPPVLLLDEPTNHLSLTLVEELEEALDGFRGALVIATHDRHLRSRWAGGVLELRPA